jgi:hypothetical protein
MHLYLFKSSHFANRYIFARSQEAAAGIYTDHRAQLNDESSEFVLKRIDDVHPWKRSQALTIALALDIEGVGKRASVQGSWKIMPTSKEHPEGMSMLVVETAIGEQLVIFAQSRERARAMSLRFVTILSELPDGWYGDEAKRFDAQGTPEQLDVITDNRNEGLGLYDHLTGWSVWPIPAALDDFSWNVT